MSCPITSTPRARCLLSWAALCLAVCACSDGDGIQRHRLRGMVTFKGKPIPKGQIIFEPDTSKGNKGPGGGCLIEEGTFDTEERMGTVGGPHRVTVYGFDGIPTRINGDDYPQGTPLFPEYKTTADLPTDGSGTFDLEVPGTR